MKSIGRRPTALLFTAAAALALVGALGGGQVAPAATVTLYATVGPGYTIGLTDANGVPVTTLTPGTYTIVVDDKSSSHNFRLTGPGGLDMKTTVSFIGKETWTVTLVPGSYHYVCDPHADGMFGDFKVIDNEAPDTSITSGPSAVVNSTSASIGFSSTEAGSTFECARDGAAFSACSSPMSYTGLADGPHSFSVRAKDPAGNTDASPASLSWTVDTVPPDTSIDAGPTGYVQDSAALFQFSSNEAGAVFSCSLDGAPLADCTTPASYAGLAAGGHTFRVEASDAAGNVDPTPAMRSWTIGGLDTTAPTTTIDSGPSGATTSDSATFAFSASESTSKFDCSLDGAAFASCTSPQSYSALSSGAHTFQVKATDAAGNVEAVAASRTWTIDLEAPDTTIGSGPAGTVASDTATFEFASSDAGSTFECALDGATASLCVSPQVYTGLAEGDHTFEVKAIDIAGNADGSPATRSWAIVLPPETSIDSGPSGTVTSEAATFSFSSNKSGATFECALDGAPFAACTSPKSYAGLSAGEHRFQVRAADPAGTTDPTPAARTWTIAVPTQLVASGLSFNLSTLTVPAGDVTLTMRNDSIIGHNIAIRGNGVDVQGPVVGQGGVSTVSANLPSGTYEFYCSVPGHAEAGMKGTLIVGDGGPGGGPGTTPPPPPAPAAPSSVSLVASGLSFNTGSLIATAGTVTISMFNSSAIPHNVAISGNGVDVQGPVVGQGQTSTVTAELKPGTYQFYCSVPGHAAAGMTGTLLVTEAGSPAPPPAAPPPTTTASAPDEAAATGEKEPSAAPRTPPARVLSCAARMVFTLSGSLVTVAQDATSLTSRVKKAKARTAKARKQARRYVGKNAKVLLHAKTGLRRQGKAASIGDFVRGDSLSVQVRMCKLTRRGALRPVAATVAAQPAKAPGGETPGALQLVATGVKFDKTVLEAKAGKVTITMRNNSPLEHNVAIKGNGVDEAGPVVKKGGSSTVTITLSPGRYEFYCSVPGHAQAGMKGVLNVSA